MFSSFNARAVGLPTLSARATIELAASVGFDGVNLLVRDLIERGEDPQETQVKDGRLWPSGWCVPPTCELAGEQVGISA